MLLVTIILAAVVAGALALLGVRLGQAGEHKHWVRAERLEAGAEFLADIDRFLSRMSAKGDDGADALETYIAELPGLLERPARTRLILLGSAETEVLVKDLLKWVSKLAADDARGATSEQFKTIGPKVGEARDALIVHLRKIAATA